MLSKEAQEITILDSQLRVFLEHHFSLDQIKQLLQFEKVQSIYQYISPFKMGLKELFYRPTDAKGFEIPDAPKKQLKRKLYLPKELWSRYLIEEELVQIFERRVVERFIFKLNNRLKRLVVIEEVQRELDDMEFISQLEQYKRPKLIKIKQLKGKSETLNTKYIPTLLKMCPFITLASIDCSISHNYYDRLRCLWLVKSGLYKTDYIVPYKASVASQPKQERFANYLQQTGIANQEVTLQQSEEIDVSEWMNSFLLRSMPDEMVPKSPLLRELIINELLTMLYQDSSKADQISAMIFQLAKSEAKLIL
jgi:hypothetical protein